ncbi:GlxA family transcriptional regulator [Archangium violaceum]|uniref:GlxA family transcriptional regulator n=1 Tax=Archangium violaceum TaxID=83451 RepID=UPI002B324B68|nr:GlxA family transcriptional regulator [Archangium violaceum]
MRVALLAYPGVAALDVTGPAEVFAAAARLTGGGYELVLLGTKPGPIPTVSSMALHPAGVISEDLGRMDTLLIAGSPGIPPVIKDAEVLEWTRREAPRCRRHGAICTGAFVLGAAGLLDGKRATTHWRFTRALAHTHPRVTVEHDSLFVRDGSTYTSAGVSSGIDLALALVEEDFGRKLALSVARELVVFLKRPGGQSQFSHQLAAQFSDLPAIQGLQQWVIDHPREDHSVERLARRVHMSPRNFARVFRRETGETPAGFVEAVRVEAARRLLESTELPIQTVADRVGFGNTNGLRRAFLRQHGTGPAEYRHSVKGAASSASQKSRGRKPGR